MPGREQHQRGVRQRGHLHLGLADAHGLDDDHVAPGGVQHPQRLGRGPGETAQVSAGGHRPDVDPGVGGVLLHPYPVTEQSAAGERRRRVDRKYTDPPPVGAKRRDERRRRRRLADAR